MSSTLGGQLEQPRQVAVPLPHEGTGASPQSIVPISVQKVTVAGPFTIDNNTKTLTDTFNLHVTIVPGHLYMAGIQYTITKITAANVIAFGLIANQTGSVPGAIAGVFTAQAPDGLSADGTGTYSSTLGTDSGSGAILALQTPPSLYGHFFFHEGKGVVDTDVSNGVDFRVSDFFLAVTSGLPASGTSATFKNITVWLVDFGALMV